jgi:hypothetical protein
MMNTQTQDEGKVDSPKESKSITSGVTVTGYAVLGCLVAGTLGIFKAVGSDGIGSAAYLGGGCSLWRRLPHLFSDRLSLVASPSNKSPEPTAVGTGHSVVAVRVTSRRWLSLLR